MRVTEIKNNENLFLNATENDFFVEWGGGGRWKLKAIQIHVWGNILAFATR